MAKKILQIEWKSFGNESIRKAFEQLGYEMEGFLLDHREQDTRRDAALTEQLVYAILAKPYAFVFSFNYFPVVAMACKACGCPYVSWTYDSPFVQLYSQTALYDTNYLFVFDQGVCRDLEQKGVRSFYLPMAAPMDGYTLLPNCVEAGGEVAFVGSLYDEISGSLLQYLDKLEGATKGYVDALIQAQKKVYGYNFVEEILLEHPEQMAQIQKICPVYAQGDGLETAEWVFANYFINRKVTVEERSEILALLAAKHDVHLYTTSQMEIPGVKRHRNVDYYREAPWVYANSKINLNMTLRSIRTGIPLRAFDIMSCGGFLLSNYQEDFFTCFEPDRDFVFYQDYGDLEEKVAFYLSHDAKRRQIARNGQECVNREHTYLQRAQQILDCM